MNMAKKNTTPDITSIIGIEQEKVLGNLILEARERACQNLEFYRLPAALRVIGKKVKPEKGFILTETEIAIIEARGKDKFWVSLGFSGARPDETHKSPANHCAQPFAQWLKRYKASKEPVKPETSESLLTSVKKILKDTKRSEILNIIKKLEAWANGTK